MASLLAWHLALAAVPPAVEVTTTSRTLAPPFGATPLARLAIVGILLVVVLIALVAAALLRRREAAARRDEPQGTDPSIAADDAIQSLSRLRDMGETLLIYLFRYAADGRMVAHCTSTPRLLGPALEAIKQDGTALATLVHPDDRLTFDAAYAARTGTARDPVEVQYRLRGANGSWKWIHERMKPIVPEGSAGEAVWDSIAIDFTARRASAERQQHLLELQRLATRVLESFLRSDDLDASVESMLAAAGETLKLSRVSFASIDPDTDTATVEREWTAPGIAGARERRQAQQLDKTGWWLPSARGGNPSVYRREEANLGLVSARSIHEEVLAMLVVPVLVHGVLRAALIFEDLTSSRRFRREEIATAQTIAFALLRGMERKVNAEEMLRVEGLQRQLERSEVVAQLAGGIAHDFNNVLFAVRGQIQILRQRVSDGEVLEALERIETSIEGASKMVTGILRAYRGDVEVAAPTPLAEEIENGCRLASRLLPETIVLERDIRELGSAHALSSPQALQRLVLNVVLNARDALVGRGRGRVRITGRITPAPGGGSQTVITVDDSGPGIPSELRERALKPFFSTKGVGGTGIGMSICQRVVKDAGGRLTLDTSPDLGGLRFIATFPIVDAAPPAAEEPETDEPETPSAADDADPALDGIGCALVVEDDPAVRRILVHALASRDIEVVERTNADEVEALLAEGAVQIDLIVMDVDLPGASGIEIARRLRAARCATPIVFVTGGTTEFDPELAPATLLRKPFPIEALPRAASLVMAMAHKG